MILLLVMLVDIVQQFKMEDMIIVLQELIYISVLLKEIVLGILILIQLILVKYLVSQHLYIVVADIFTDN